VFECVRTFRSCRFCESIPWLLIALFNTLTLHSLHSQVPCPVTWGATTQISNTTFSAFVPKVVVVGDTVHVTYRAGHLYYQHSTDAGRTWSAPFVVVPAESLSGQIWNRPFTANSNNLYVVWGNSSPSGAITSVKIRRSTDAGETWLDPQTLIRNSGLFYYEAPKVAAWGQHVYIALRYSGQGHVFFMHSTDNGVMWDSVRQITFGTPGHGAWDVTPSALGVHIVGTRNDQPSGVEIGYLVSTDHGLTWSQSQVLSAIDNYQAWGPNVAADDAGNVYVSWQDAKYGSIGGFAGAVLLRRSSDNGQTWMPEVQVSPLASARFSTISSVDNRVHVVWDDERNGFQDGTVNHRGSSDGGLTWCDEQVLGGPLRRALDASVAATQQCLYVAWSSDRSTPGDTAHVFIRRGDVITSMREGDRTLPAKFTVSPFYPNPFNPSTRVQYTVPYQGRLIITVYDLLGRKVKDLFNRIQSPGVFEVDFDGSMFASGVYYVRFQFNEQMTTKAVVLMR